MDGASYILEARSDKALSYINDNTGCDIPLCTSSKTEIGRGVNGPNDFVLPIDWVQISTRHCKIYFEKDQWFVIDSSTNGTFINNKRCIKNQPTPLNVGDHIRLSVAAPSAAAGSPIASPLEYIFVRRGEEQQPPPLSQEPNNKVSNVKCASAGTLGVKRHSGEMMKANNNNNDSGDVTRRLIVPSASPPEAANNNNNNKATGDDNSKRQRRSRSSSYPAMEEEREDTDGLLKSNNHPSSTGAGGGDMKASIELQQKNHQLRTDLVKMLQEKEKADASLVDAMEKHAAELAAVKQQHEQEMQRTTADFTRQLEEQKARVESAGQAVQAQMCKEMADMTERLATMTSTNTQLQQQLECAKQEMHELHAELEMMKTNVASMEVMDQRHEEEERLRAALREKEAENQRLLIEQEDFKERQALMSQIIVNVQKKAGETEKAMSTMMESLKEASGLMVDLDTKAITAAAAAAVVADMPATTAAAQGCEEEEEEEEEEGARGEQVSQQQQHKEDGGGDTDMMVVAARPTIETQVVVVVATATADADAEEHVNSDGGDARTGSKEEEEEEEEEREVARKLFATQQQQQQQPQDDEAVAVVDEEVVDAMEEEEEEKEQGAHPPLPLSQQQHPLMNTQEMVHNLVDNAIRKATDEAGFNNNTRQREEENEEMNVVSQQHMVGSLEI